LRSLLMIWRSFSFGIVSAGCLVIADVLRQHKSDRTYIRSLRSRASTKSPLHLLLHVPA
jgi:hypothetical protein